MNTRLTGCSKRLLCLLAGGLLSCSPEQSMPPPPLEVEYAGCTEVWAGPACAPSDEHRIALWAKSSQDAGLVVMVDGERVEVPATAVQGGVHFNVPVEDSSSSVSVKAVRGNSAAQWTLALREESRPEVLRRAGEFKQSCGRTRQSGSAPRGSCDEAIESLKDERSRLALSTSGYIDSLIARLHFFKNENAEAFRVLESAMLTHEKSGQLRSLARDKLKYARALDRRAERLRDALAVLEEAAALFDELPEEKAIRQYTLGLIYQRTGDLRQAYVLIKDAVERAERLGMHKLANDFRQLLSNTLALMGRSDEAEETLQAVQQALADNGDADSRVRALTNICWVRILAREATREAPDALAACKDAWDAVDRSVGDPRRRANALLNLADAHFQTDDFSTATNVLDRIGNPVPDNAVKWLMGLRARIALEEGRLTEALAKYDNLQNEYDDLTEEMWWRTELGRGRALEGLGQDDKAVSAYESAEEVLAHQSLYVPLDQGRDTFMGDHGESARLLIDLLVDLDRPEEAFAAARRSRRRLLGSLWVAPLMSQMDPAQRERWSKGLAAYRARRKQINQAASHDQQLSKSDMMKARQERRRQEREARKVLDSALSLPEWGSTLRDDVLPEPSSEELVLLYHPVRDGEWVGFAASRDTVKAQRFRVPVNATSQQLSESLLGPFAAELSQAIELGHTLTVMASGMLLTVDFHALPWGDEILLEKLPVQYRLDMAPSLRAVSPNNHNEVLIVADPTLGLPKAQREAAVVRKRFKSGQKVLVLVGDDATSYAVNRAMTASDWFHYAGHSDQSDSNPWDHVLSLSRKTSLGLGDVLAYEHVPRSVVLSSCESGQANSQAAGLTINIAQAFVAAGAQTVVASARVVRDTMALSFAKELYHDDVDTTSIDLVKRLRRAQLAIRAAGGGVDWATYRALVR